jgi:hypothetical protein
MTIVLSSISYWLPCVDSMQQISLDKIPFIQKEFKIETGTFKGKVWSKMKLHRLVLCVKDRQISS